MKKEGEKKKKKGDTGFLYVFSSLKIIVYRASYRIFRNLRKIPLRGILAGEYVSGAMF